MFSSLSVCQSGISTINSVSFMPLHPFTLSPSHYHAFFCFISGLWCSSNTKKITLTFSLCFPHAVPDTRVHSQPLLPEKHPSTTPSLCPLLSHPSSLFEVIRALCLSSQLLSSLTEKERNVFRLCWSTVICPPVWSDSLVTHSFIGSFLNKQPLDVPFPSRSTVVATENVSLIVPLQLGDPLLNEVVLVQSNHFSAISLTSLRASVHIQKKIIKRLLG